MTRPRLVITRTPLRVSFVGGGTDLPSFFTVDPPGRVVSTAIDKYVYVTVKPHAEIFEERYRISYSHVETVGERQHITNETIRGCLEHVGIDEPLYIATCSDIPASSGLGSSSSLAVGLLNALYAYIGQPVTRGQLAEAACEVEIGRLKRPIGKQDQYAAAFGGLNTFDFNADGSVMITPVLANQDYLIKFFSSLALYWTNITRPAESILLLQNERTKLQLNADSLRSMRDAVGTFTALLGQQASMASFGALLGANWALKCSLARNVSTDEIYSAYCRAFETGAYGGKLCGAGGGGFLLMISRPEDMQAIAAAMGVKFHVRPQPDTDGTHILVVAH